MLSICIPVYNYSVQKLIQQLILQCSDFSLDEIEIVLIDDASQTFFIEQNRKVESDYIRWIFLKQNVGRAVIRNLFLQYVKGNYLLFLDCDSEIKVEDFVKNYLYLIKYKDVKVVCGGRDYPLVCENNSQKLRWKYGILRESKSSVVRSEFPNKSFMTNNFLIARSILLENPFNEELKLYGHEDTWFGYQLQSKGVEILHIENPVLNGEIETNEIFLQKTEQAVNSLIFLVKTQGKIADFENTVQLLTYYRRLEKMKILPVFKLFFSLTKEILRPAILVSKSLILFDLYKLGYLSMRMK